MKKSGAVFIALSTMAIGSVAFAGNKGTYPVTIDNAHLTASGSLGSARNSSDSIQYIEIVNNVDSAGNPGVQFFFRDAASNSAYCFSSAAGILAVAHSAPSDAIVTIHWDTNHNCTYVESRTDSLAPPKNP